MKHPRKERKKLILTALEEGGFLSRYGSSIRYVREEIVVAIRLDPDSYSDGIWMDVGFGPHEFFAEKGRKFYQIPASERVEHMFPEHREALLSLLGHFDNELDLDFCMQVLRREILGKLKSCARIQTFSELAASGRLAGAMDLGGWIQQRAMGQSFPDLPNSR